MSKTRAVITDEVDLLAILILDAELDAPSIVLAGNSEHFPEGFPKPRRRLGSLSAAIPLLNSKCHGALRLALVKCVGDGPNQ